MTTATTPSLTTAPSGIERVVRRATAGGPLTTIVVPVVAVLAALIIGSILIAFEGTNPLAVYWAIVEAVVTKKRGFSDTAIAATPLLLLGLGYAVAYRARVFTIGAEGQYLIGATFGTWWVTSSGVSGMPGFVLVLSGLLVGVVSGALWSLLAGWLGVRFGANIVISSLMLVYIGAAILAWGVRAGFKDPDAFVNQSRQVGAAALPTLPGTSTHLGFLIAVLLVPAITVGLYRHRAGFRVSALGHNASALDANETPSGRLVLGVMALAGALAGLAGMVETVGVNGRLTASASVGFGFTAIIVALLGRLHPVGVLIASLGLGALTIGFEAAEREFDLPASLVGVITALIVVFVVIGDALASRGREGT